MRSEVPDRWQVRWALLKRDPRLVERFTAFQRQLASLPRRARRWLERKAVMTLTTAALLLALSGVPLAHAAGITVTTTNPNIIADGQCSLIEAIDNANNDAQTHADCPAGSGADIISLPASSTITLTSVNNGANGLPQITSAITIEGNGVTIIRDSSAPAFRIFQVGGSLVLNNSTVTGGNINFGGGIHNFGTLTLNNSTVSGNNASYVGGGIHNNGTLTLNNSTVSGNSTGGSGGGILNRGALTLNNSTVSGNNASSVGGGIYNESATLTLNNSTISGNSARFGGGITNFYGTVTLVRSLISGNTAQGLPEIMNNYYNYGANIIGNNFNLIGHNGDAGSNGFSPSGSDIVPSQPLAAILSPLANNGGPTLTHALVTGSPAVDAALTGPAADQRGVTRPQGSAFDIGAFELEQQALFNFSGFFQPVDNLPTLNTVKAGQGVPVKFSLDGDQGLAIFAEGYPVSQQAACEGGAPLDAIEQTVTAGGSSLSYDPATNTYTYVWKTESSWKNSCRTLIVRLSDGTEHAANFKFK